MNTNHHLTQIRATLPQLNPTRLAHKLDEYTRGNLPAGGTRHGGRSADQPHPALDHTDAEIAAARTHYQTAIQRAANALQSALNIQNAWTQPAPPLEPAPDWCANPHCHHGPDGQPRQVGLDPSNPNDRLRKGPISGLKICFNDYMYEYRTGLRSDRPTHTHETEGAA